MQSPTTANDGIRTTAPVPPVQRCQVKTKSRRSRRPLPTCDGSTPSASSASFASTSSSSFLSPSSHVSLPLASAPRTVEFLWSGCTAPGFTLKRKRSGAILVSTVTHETQVATTLRVGSEFKLVGGFPVNRLTLQDVKKVMLLAPKPVSLVFVNTSDVIVSAVDVDVDVDADRTQGNLLTVARRKLSSATSTTGPSLASTTGILRRSVSLNSRSVMDKSSNSDTSRRRSFAKEHKVSKLQLALHRVNQLLNRPVRRAGLHVTVDKSIVV